MYAMGCCSCLRRYMSYQYVGLRAEDPFDKPLAKNASFAEILCWNTDRNSRVDFLEGRGNGGLIKCLLDSTMHKIEIRIKLPWLISLCWILYLLSYLGSIYVHTYVDNFFRRNVELSETHQQRSRESKTKYELSGIQAVLGWLAKSTR